MGNGDECWSSFENSHFFLSSDWCVVYITLLCYMFLASTMKMLTRAE